MRLFKDYLNTLAKLNRLDNGYKPTWCFHAGMLFATPLKWWGDFKNRASIHEGVDITYYRDDKGVLHQFDDAIVIPAFENGTVLNICNDFLGQSLVVENESFQPVQGWRSVIVYAHIDVNEEILPGSAIRCGKPVATVCKTNKNPALPPHLHFSCFEISTSVPETELDWNLFSTSRDIRMVHPFFL